MKTALSYLLNLQVLGTLITGQTSFLSTSNDDYTPDHLWMLDKSHHGNSDKTKTLYAILHDVNLTSGPIFNGNAAGALYFKGNPSSYAEISYARGELNASVIFSWTMLLRPNNLTGSGVILEYWDGVGGIRFQQSNTSVVVEAQDMRNNTYTKTVDKVFTADKTSGAIDWIFLGVCYIFTGTSKPSVGFKMYYDTYTKIDSNTATQTVPEGTVLRGTGTVRLGGSAVSGLPSFAGSVSCLRFHKTFINKFSSATAYADQCDPKGTFTAQYNLTEYTKDYAETTSTVITTFTTTQQTTVTPQTTSSGETSQAITVQETSPTTPNATSTSTSTSTTTITMATSAAGLLPKTMDVQWPMRDKCYRLLRKPGTGKFEQNYILSRQTVNSLSACADYCASLSGCVAISVGKAMIDKNEVGQCLLGRSGYTTTPDAAFYLYTFLT